MSTLIAAPTFWKAGPSQVTGPGVGARVGNKGTHTSRTMMLAELTAVLEAVPVTAKRADYAAAIVTHNCLRKPTSASRQLTNQRLGELYGLDPAVPLFRVLRRLWDRDERSRPLLALLAAIARDPLLAATAPVVFALPQNAELPRAALEAALRASVAERLNDATLAKVVRNTASSWAQSGHLVGRTFKKRRAVQATPAAAAFALYLAHAGGYRGSELLASPWMAALDCSPSDARDLALEAKRLGLIDVRTGGDVLQVCVDRLDPGVGRA